MAARNFGLLEAIELVAYDAYIRLRPADSSPSTRISLVTISEHDIQANGWPLSDDVLARTIEVVARHKPRAIGLDIYRDVPILPGRRKLEAVLAAEPRVVAAMKFAEGASSGVRPPPVLRGTEQVGFNDILVDPGGVVRRGLLFLDDGTAVSYSFALRLALRYLQAQGVVPQADPHDPSLLRLGAVTIRPLEPHE